MYVGQFTVGQPLDMLQCSVNTSCYRRNTWGPCTARVYLLYCSPSALKYGVHMQYHPKQIFVEYITKPYSTGFWMSSLHITLQYILQYKKMVTFMLCQKCRRRCSMRKGKAHVNTLRPRQKCCHFADDMFNCIYLLNTKGWISLNVSLKFVFRVRISNIQALVQIMSWRWPGDMPLSDPMMISLLTHICVTRPQRVNILRQSDRNKAGQSREILFEFGYTFAIALAASEAYPTTALDARGGRVIDPKHQIVYLAHVNRWRCCSKMRLSGAEPVWNQTAACLSRQVDLIFCDA